MQKIVSQLDRDGYFVGETAADESPLEPGVFLIPARAVDAPAPVVPEGHRAKWVGEWVVESIPATTQPSTDSPKAPSIPVCTPWQIRKALNALGLRQQVETAVAASEVQEVHDGWEFATEFRADDPFVLGIGQAVGKTGAEVAEIITYASSL